MSEFEDWCQKPEVVMTGRGWGIRINGCDVFDPINQHGCKGLRSFDVVKGLTSKEEAEAFRVDWLIQQLPDKLRAVLAQEAGHEQQEPFAYSFRFAGCVTSSGPENWRNEIDREKPAQFLFDDGRVKDFKPLYTSPPAPVSVLLPPYMPGDTEDSYVLTDCRNEGWNACLDKVKELNQ